MHYDLNLINRIGILFVLISLMFLTQACSGSKSPTTPEMSHPSAVEPFRQNLSHSYLWYGMVSIDPDAGTAEFIPVRLSATHFNVRTFMENGPCTDCMTLQNLEILPDDILSFDVMLTHPFPGLNNLVGFDVRGIVILNAGELWPANNLMVSRGTLGNGELLNADGYTRLYNPVEFPPGSVGVGLWEYSKGKMAPDVDLTGSLNGYIAYETDKTRRVFETMVPRSAHYLLKKPDGPLLFGYAIDANHSKADPTLTGDPLIIDVPDDFPFTANCPEAYQITTTATQGLYADGTGSANIYVDLYDWQDDADLANVQIECPDIFSGLLTMDVESIQADFVRFEVEVANSLVAPEGLYPYLVSAEDVTNPLSLLPLIAYDFGTIGVNYFDPIAIADASPLSQIVGEFIHFYDDGSYDPDGGDIVTYEWDWDNDGTFDEESADTNHAWDEVGIYYVQFRVTDDEGAIDTLDEPIEILIYNEAVPEPVLITEILDVFHSPLCAKIDTQMDDAYVNSTQASPVLDYHIRKIDNDEQVEDTFNATGMGGWFGLNVDARKIIAPQVLGVVQGKVEVFDLDGGPVDTFTFPLGPMMWRFLGDGEIFHDLSTAVVVDSIENELIVFDYTDPGTGFQYFPSAGFPQIVEADYEGHRLFIYCVGTGTSDPSIQVWDAETWTLITEFPTVDPVAPFMSDMDYNPAYNHLYFGSGLEGLEIWDTETWTYLATINVGCGEVQGVDHMGSAIYITCAGGHLLVYDAATFTQLWDVSCGVDPRCLACNPNTEKIYVPDMSSPASVLVFQG